MEHGQPLRFGATVARRSSRSTDGALSIDEDVADDDPRVVVHDAHAENPAYAFALSRLQSLDSRYAPMGVFRSVERPTYDELMAEQLDDRGSEGARRRRRAADAARGADTWQVA